MSPSEVLNRLDQLGGTISSIDKVSLRVRAQKPLPADIVDDLRAHKAVILKLLVGQRDGAPHKRAVSAGNPQAATVPSGNEGRRRKAVPGEPPALSQDAEGSPQRIPPLVKGKAVCLYSDLVGEELWIVADEEDAQTLLAQGERRGRIYTPDEVRLVIAIKDPSIVKQVHEFKREFDTRLGP